MVRWIQLSIAQPGPANSTFRVQQAQQGQTAEGHAEQQWSYCRLGQVKGRRPSSNHRNCSLKVLTH